MRAALLLAVAAVLLWPAGAAHPARARRAAPRRAGRGLVVRARDGRGPRPVRSVRVRRA